MSEREKESGALFFDRARFGAETPAWMRLRAEPMADCRVFKVRRDWCVRPGDASEHDFYCIEAPDWINIIPLTARREVVMIEQYRHGTNEVTLEIPGGMVDEGETPRETAGRELFEETGYEPGEVTWLGKTRPNPAIQNNWIHTFLARDTTFRRAPVFESTEHTVVRLVPLAQVPALISDGTINHSLVVVGFHFLSLYQAGWLEELPAEHGGLDHDRI
ncbi:MAG TPA: NUDIX hydrolase [Pyrinomonadaceae bacterium]